MSFIVHKDDVYHQLAVTNSLGFKEGPIICNVGGLPAAAPTELPANLPLKTICGGRVINKCAITIEGSLNGNPAAGASHKLRVNHPDVRAGDTIQLTPVITPGCPIKILASLGEIRNGKQFDIIITRLLANDVGRFCLKVTHVKRSN